MEEHSEDEGATAPSLMFSRNASIPVENVLTRVLTEDETRRTSNEPCFHIYSHFQQRMIADILMPSKGFDCRLIADGKLTANDIKKGRKKARRAKYWMIFAISFTDQKNN